MDYEYSWEGSSSTYTPPRRDGVGWYFLVAVILALAAHVVLLVAAGNFLIKNEITEPREIVTQPIRLSTVEPMLDEAPVEAPPEEDIIRPETEMELIDDTDDALAEIQNVDIDIDTNLAEPELPKMKIEKPQLQGVDSGTLLKPSIAANATPDIPDPGKIQLDFPEAKTGQIVVDQGSLVADKIDPKAALAALDRMKGAGGHAETGEITGYTGLAEYAKMSPGDLMKNKASIGSDLLFAYNEATLRDDARLTLMTVAMLIDRNPKMYCWVEGHTDLFGGDAFNNRLSERRGQAVKDWLVQALQLDASRIIVRPLGKTQPLVTEGDQDAQAPNRRVDIKMRKTLPPPVDAPPKLIVKPGKAVIVPEEKEEEEIPKAVIVPEEDEEPEKEEIPKAIPVTE